MSKAVLILGDSGTGKSTAIRTLPAEHTFIINVEGKNLPFKGMKTKYRASATGELPVNYYCSDKISGIISIIKAVNERRPDIKYLVIDDCGYLIMNEFMRRALEKGYEKYNVLGKQFADLISLVTQLRDDLFCFVTMHPETDQAGKTKPKTVGKMIDQYICIEGKFTYVLHSLVMEGEYKFLTNSDGCHMAKTPLGMFEEKYIDNDLLFIAQTIDKYLTDDINEDINQ